MLVEKNLRTYKIISK